MIESCAAGCGEPIDTRQRDEYVITFRGGFPTFTHRWCVEAASLPRSGADGPQPEAGKALGLKGAEPGERAVDRAMTLAGRADAGGLSLSDSTAKSLSDPASVAPASAGNPGVVSSRGRL